MKCSFTAFKLDKAGAKTLRSFTDLSRAFYLLILSSRYFYRNEYFIAQNNSWCAAIGNKPNNSICVLWKFRKEIDFFLILLFLYKGKRGFVDFLEALMKWKTWGNTFCYCTIRRGDWQLFSGEFDSFSCENINIIFMYCPLLCFYVVRTRTVCEEGWDTKTIEHVVLLSRSIQFY